MVKRNKRTHSKQSLKTLYLEIWNERQHNCTVCKKYLWNEPKAHFFAHILSKGAYPSYKFNKENITILCYDCHYRFDFGSSKDDERFAWLHKEKEKLKRKYFYEIK